MDNMIEYKKSIYYSGLTTLKIFVNFRFNDYKKAYNYITELQLIKPSVLNHYILGLCLLNDNTILDYSQNQLIRRIIIHFELGIILYMVIYKSYLDNESDTDIFYDMLDMLIMYYKSTDDQQNLLLFCGIGAKYNHIQSFEVLGNIYMNSNRISAISFLNRGVQFCSINCYKKLIDLYINEDNIENAEQYIFDLYKLMLDPTYIYIMLEMYYNNNYISKITILKLNLILEKHLNDIQLHIKKFIITFIVNYKLPIYIFDILFYNYGSECDICSTYKYFFTKYTCNHISCANCLVNICKHNELCCCSMCRFIILHTDF